MQYSAVKRYKRRHKILGSLLLKNPVLVMGLDLPFIIAASTSLKNAAAMSLVMILVHTVTVSVGLVTCRKFPMWLRMVANAFVSTIVMMVAQVLAFRLFRGVSASLGMYLYLLAVNGMTLLQSTTVGRRSRPGPVITTALLNAVGFSLVACVVAAVREYFGSGALWGIPMNVSLRLSGLLIPFGGFMVTAFLLAAAKFLNKRLLGLFLRESIRREEQYAKIEIISEELL